MSTRRCLPAASSLAVTTLSRAEKIAAELPPSDRHQATFFFLTSALAKRDPAGAVIWLEKIQGQSFAVDGTILAAQFLPQHPAAAEQVWKRSGDRIERTRPNQLASRANHIPGFCYGMAAADLARAQRIARQEAEPSVRLRGLGAIALWLADHDRSAGQKLLSELIRDELPRCEVAADFKPFDCQLAPSIAAAWLLPIAERIDRQLGRECFWRALALRPPRPRADKLDDEIAGIDIQLAMMLSRYDREVARALLDPQIARLPEIAACGSSGGEAPHARVVHGRAVTETATILAAALNIDAHWSAELFAGLPKGEREPERRFQMWVRNYYCVSALSQHLRGRWGRPGVFSYFSANYWEPEAAPPAR